MLETRVSYPESLEISIASYGYLSEVDKLMSDIAEVLTNATTL